MVRKNQAVDKYNITLQVSSALELMSKKTDLIKDTHGNVSQYDGNNLVAIKPSGVEYAEITQDDVCVIDIHTGNVIYNKRLKPSVDTLHHLAIYRNNPSVRAICHTHSPYATAFAMCGTYIQCACTEQADIFGGNIHCAEYVDLNSWGEAVKLDENQNAILLERHGVLTFANDAVSAVKLAIAVENVAFKTWLAQDISSFRDNRYLSTMPTNEIEKWNARYKNSYGQ